MKSFLRYFFELGHLKRVPRSGWTLLGINSPESVAEHTARAAQIAFFLAVQEGSENPYRVCTMVTFHDTGETRTQDLHKLAHRYVTKDELQAVRDQCAPLEGFGEKVLGLWEEFAAKESRDAIIAHDADMVDVAVQAKEYMDSGFPGALEWITYARDRVRTPTAQTLIDGLIEVRLTDWWKGLKKL